MDMMDLRTIGRMAASIAQATTTRMLAPIARRVRLMVARAVITAIDDAGKIQTAQVKLLDGEVRDGIEILHQYGFTSRPRGKPEGLYFSVGGDRDHGVMICAADRAHRLTDLAPGETALYTDEDQPGNEHRIHFKNGREIHVMAGLTRIVLTPAGITITTPALDIVKI